MPSGHAMHYKVSIGINTSIKKKVKCKKKNNVFSAVKNVEFAPLCSKRYKGYLGLQ